jgi:uncharacterized protein
MSKISSPKYLEPELYFVEKIVRLGDPEYGEEVKVSQLVKKGDVLIDFPQFSRLKSKGFTKQPLELGENVELSETDNSLIATATGYPKIRKIDNKEKGPPSLFISITPLVSISHDKMEAILEIHPPIPNAPSLVGELIRDFILEAKVTSGLLDDAISKAQQLINRGNFGFEKIIIAKGEFPSEGTDATVKYDLEIGPLAGRKLDDGSIDFRDRKIMVNVKSGQTIATKIPQIPGEPGYNVFGEEIAPRKGKDIKIKVTGDTSFNREDNTVKATKDGALTIVNDDVIKVSTRHTILTDIDFKTGNIESGNCVIIKGSVQPGFQVNVDGDLEIGGAVSGGKVQSRGNIVIKGGITGQETTIKADGDIDLQFIERAKLQSGGLIVIRKQCYYSEVRAFADIRCHKNSKLIGGLAIAGGNLTVGQVGAENCQPALLAAGVDFERYQLLLDLKKQLSEQQEETIETMQLLGRNARSKKIRRMEEKEEELKLQIMQLNLIPGTELYSRVGKGKDRDEIAEDAPLYQKGIEIEKIRIEIHGTVYGGTKLLIGNRSATLGQNVAKRRYRLSKNLKNIMAIPF